MKKVFAGFGRLQTYDKRRACCVTSWNYFELLCEFLQWLKLELKVDLPGAFLITFSLTFKNCFRLVDEHLSSIS